MRSAFRKRPWIALVILYLAVLAVHAVFVWVAERNPAIPVEETAPPSSP